MEGKSASGRANITRIACACIVNVFVLNPKRALSDLHPANQIVLLLYKIIQLSEIITKSLPENEHFSLLFCWVRLFFIVFERNPFKTAVLIYCQLHLIHKIIKPVIYRVARLTGHIRFFLWLPIRFDNIIFR